MYETRLQPIISSRRFRQRMAKHGSVALLLIAGSLALGILGYMAFERLSFLDALLNASMLLGGMGPVNAPVTPVGKIFASLYALYAGLAFIVTAAILFTPVLHRLMHRFHIDDRSK